MTLYVPAWYSCLLRISEREGEADLWEELTKLQSYILTHSSARRDQVGVYDTDAPSTQQVSLPH